MLLKQVWFFAYWKIFTLYFSFSYPLIEKKFILKDKNMINVMSNKLIMTPF